MWYRRVHGRLLVFSIWPCECRNWGLQSAIRGSLIVNNLGLAVGTRQYSKCPRPVAFSNTDILIPTSPRYCILYPTPTLLGALDIPMSASIAKQLPVELWYKVLEHVDKNQELVDLWMSYRHVCRAWRDAAESVFRDMHLSKTTLEFHLGKQS